MKFFKNLKFQYHGKDYVLSNSEPSRDIHNTPILVGAVVEVDGQPQRPARRTAFVIEDTNLPSQIKREIEQCPTAMQVAFEEWAELREVSRELTSKQAQSRAPNGKTARPPKKRSISREEVEAWLFPKNDVNT